MAGPGLRNQQERKLLDINFDDAKFENMLRSRNFAAPLLGVKSVYETEPWTETVDVLNEDYKDQFTYKKAMKLLGTKQGKSDESQENFGVTLKNTVIVDYDGFQPKDHVKVQGLQNKPRKLRKDLTTFPKKQVYKKKFNLSLPMLKETLSKIKVPIFKGLFRQTRHNQDQQPVSDNTNMKYFSEFEKGKNIPEGYRMGGLDRTAVNKHTISLSEFDDIQSIVLNNQHKRNTTDGSLGFSGGVPPHLIHLQDFN